MSYTWVQVIRQKIRYKICFLCHQSSVYSLSMCMCSHSYHLWLICAWVAIILHVHQPFLQKKVVASDFSVGFWPRFCVLVAPPTSGNLFACGKWQFSHIRTSAGAVFLPWFYFTVKTWDQDLGFEARTWSMFWSNLENNYAQSHAMLWDITPRVCGATPTSNLSSI